MVFKNSKEIYDALTDLQKSDSAVYFALSDQGDFMKAPLEYLQGDFFALGLEDKSCSFSSLLTSHENYLSLESFNTYRDFKKTMEALHAPHAFGSFEFPYIEGNHHFLFSCRVYHDEAKHVFILALSRLSVFEGYLAEYSEKSQRDYTTDLLNKERCLNEIRAILPTDKAVVIFCDLNNFKLINDVYGHIKGDAVLKRFAAVLLKAKGLDPKTNIYRFGGDEFVVIMRGGDKARCLAYLDEVKERFQDNPPGAIPTSFSAGCLENSPAIKDSLFLIRCSDMAMYMAKRHNSDFYFLSEEEALSIIENDTNSGQL